MNETQNEKPLIIVIDDDESMREGCRQVLENAGYWAYAVEDGERGVRMVEEMAPDIVLVDLKMPGMSGVEVLRNIREIDPHIVPIVITAYGTVESTIEVMKTGAYDFLQKPFDDNVLRMTVGRALEKRRLEKELAAAEREKKMSLDSFAAALSEQLMQPIADARQQVEELLKQWADRLAPQQKLALEHIAGRMASLARVVEGWLKLAQADIEITSLQSCTVRLPELIQEAWQNEAKENEWPHFRLNAKSDAVSVLGSDDLLGQAFAALFHLCARFVPETGAVVVDVNEDGRHGIVSVTGTGWRMGEEEIAHLFDLFGRGSQLGEGEGGDTGLGFAFIKRIVRAHGGEITAESAPGGGVTFRIAMPVGD